MAQSNSNLVSTNAMSAKQLVISQNSQLEFHDFDGQDGKHHTLFVCASITGHVSPNAKASIRGGRTIDQLKYAEVSRDGGAPVPCLMIVGNGHQANKTFGAELLR